MTQHSAAIAGTLCLGSVHLPTHVEDALHDGCHPVRCQLAKRHAICSVSWKPLHSIQEEAKKRDRFTHYRGSSACALAAHTHTCAFVWRFHLSCGPVCSKLEVCNKQHAGPTKPLGSWRTSGLHALRAIVVSCSYVNLALTYVHINTHACTSPGSDNLSRLASTSSLARRLWPAMCPSCECVCRSVGLDDAG